MLMTPSGSAGIAVVRLAGPMTGDFLQAHFSKPAQLSRCVHGEISQGGRVIDDAVVVRVSETVIDLNLHGGPWIVQSVFELAQRSGFVVFRYPALPLPVAATDAASTLEGEVLSHLPLARTELGVRALLAQPAAWSDLISKTPQPDPLRRILADVTLECLLHPGRVAIVGAANVGKSTLANQLFARERSITADVPGTTRDWVGEIANIDGLPVMLLDTPGLRATEDPIEAEAIRRSGGEVEKADLTVLVIDASRPLIGEQAELLKRFPRAIRVVNKVDKCGGWDIEELCALQTVATVGTGTEALRRRIVFDLCREEPIQVHRPRCWTERQREIIGLAIKDPSKIQDI
jgi:tRNA modification GTPase